jgi:hypothetical protein
MAYCERHLAVGIEVQTNRRLAGWPICDDCFDGKPITRAEVEARVESGTAFHTARSPGRPPLDIDSFELADEYEAGATLSELAARHHCGRQTVADRLKWVGVDFRPRGPKKARSLSDA